MRDRDTVRAVACTLVGLLLATAPAAARNPIVVQWESKMARSTKALRAGKYDRALKLSSWVVKDMMESLGTGHDATRAFGIALTHRALALAGLGRNEDALWEWHTILSLFPGFARGDVGSFGAPGAFLAANPLPPEPPDFDPEVAARIRPPKELERVQPRFPEGARQFRTTGTLVVRVAITKEGTISSPRVLTPLPAPTLSYAALEAVRKWRYEPAMLDGVPIATTLTVSVTYKLE